MANITIIKVSANTGKLGDVLKQLLADGMTTDEAVAALAEVGVNAQDSAETEVAVEIAEEQPSSDEPELELPQPEKAPELQEITYVTAEELVEA